MCQVFVHFSLLSPTMCHLIVPKNWGTPGFTEKNTFFWKGFKGNLNKEPLATTILNPAFVKCVKFLRIFHCNRPERAIWLFPKIAGTPGFTQKNMFFERFTGNLKKEPLATTIRNPVFVKGAGCLWAFFIAECAIWSFPILRGWAIAAIAVKTRRNPGAIQEVPFLKVFQKKLNQTTANHQNRNSKKRFAAKVWVFACFSLQWHRVCHLIVPKIEGLGHSS